MRAKKGASNLAPGQAKWRVRALSLASPCALPSGQCACSLAGCHEQRRLRNQPARRRRLRTDANDVLMAPAWLGCSSVPACAAHDYAIGSQRATPATPGARMTQPGCANNNVRAYLATAIGVPTKKRERIMDDGWRARSQAPIGRAARCPTALVLHAIRARSLPSARTRLKSDENREGETEGEQEEPTASPASQQDGSEMADQSATKRGHTRTENALARWLARWLPGCARTAYALQLDQTANPNNYHCSHAMLRNFRAAGHSCAPALPPILFYSRQPNPTKEPNARAHQSAANAAANQP